MGKKENGFMVLMIFLLDIIVGWAWYGILYHPEITTHIETVITSAALMFFTLISFAMNFIIYYIAVSED